MSARRFESLVQTPTGTLVRYTNPTRVTAANGELFRCAVCTNRFNSEAEARKCAEDDHTSKGEQVMTTATCLTENGYALCEAHKQAWQRGGWSGRIDDYRNAPEAIGTILAGAPGTVECPDCVDADGSFARPFHCERAECANELTLADIQAGDGLCSFCAQSDEAVQS